MKVLAIVLLCAFAGAQGRSAVKFVDNELSEVAQKTETWVVHLRYATRDSGLLQTATGSLISERFVLTYRQINDASFIWVRFGAVNVIQPILVVETSAVQIQGSLALINLNRNVQLVDSISAIPLDEPYGNADGVSCGYGLSANGGPGEKQQCSNIDLEQTEDGKLTGSSDILKEFDLGAALVKDGHQIALLVSVDGVSVEYEPLTRADLEWIGDVANVPISPPPTIPAPTTTQQPESESDSSSDSSDSSDSSESEERSRVKFVRF